MITEQDCLDLGWTPARDGFEIINEGNHILGDVLPVPFKHVWYLVPDPLGSSIVCESGVGNQIVYLGGIPDKEALGSLMIWLGIKEFPPKYIADLTDEQCIEIAKLAADEDDLGSPEVNRYADGDIWVRWKSTEIGVHSCLDISAWSYNEMFSPNNQYKIQTLLREWGIKPKS